MNIVQRLEKTKWRDCCYDVIENAILDRGNVIENAILDRGKLMLTHLPFVAKKQWFVNFLPRYSISPPLIRENLIKFERQEISADSLVDAIPRTQLL